mgnify:CR=1 FL=1
MLTRDGFPMGHEVFPGDTAEVETFRVAFDKAKRQFDLKQVILVADRGIVSEEVLREIDHLEQVKAVEISLDGKRYLARTELVGHADLAFRAPGTRPPPQVTELPRRHSEPGEECCGPRDPYAAKPNDDKASQK